MKQFVINRKGASLEDSIKKQKDAARAHDGDSSIQYMRNVADDDSTPSNLSKQYSGLVPDALNSASMTGLVDASNLLAQGGDKNSNLTSNVDSVMSYLGADKKEASVRSDAVAPAADNSEYRIDLRLLNAEIN